MVNNNKREKKMDKIVVTLHLALLLVIPLVLHLDLDLDLDLVAVVRLLEWEIPLVQDFKKRPVKLDGRDLYYINSKMKE